MTDLELEKLKQKQKSTLVAFVLWWFVGIFGGHRFYMKKPHAVTMLILGVLGILTMTFLVGFVFLIIVWIMMIVDAFKIPTWVTDYNIEIIEEEEKKEAELKN